MEIKSATEQKSLLASSPRQAGAPAPPAVRVRPRQRHAAAAADRPGHRARPRDFFPTPPRRTPSTSSGSRPRPATRRSPARSASPPKYYPDYAGQVPLLLKVNGKTDVPPPTTRSRPATPRSRTRCASGPTRSATRSTWARRARTPDLIQLRQIRQDCDRFGIPLIIWAYPRGAASTRRAAASFYAIDYAARDRDGDGRRRRQAQLPEARPEKDKVAPAPYNEMDIYQGEAIRQVVESAGRSLVVLSGGSKVDHDQLFSADPLHRSPGVLA